MQKYRLPTKFQDNGARQAADQFADVHNDLMFWCLDFTDIHTDDFTDVRTDVLQHKGCRFDSLVQHRWCALSRQYVVRFVK